MLHLLIQSVLVYDVVFYLTLIELLFWIRCTHNQPQVLISLGPAWNVDRCKASFLLNKILRFVMDQKVVNKDFKLFAKSVFISFGISSKPLICHFVLYQYCVIYSNRLTSHFQSNVWVRVFKDPDSIVILFQHKYGFLESWNFTVSIDWDGFTVQVNWSIEEQRVDSDFDLLSIMQDIILESIAKISPFQNKDRSRTRMDILNSWDVVGLFSIR